MTTSLFEEASVKESPTKEAPVKTAPAAPRTSTAPVRIWCDGACSGNPGPGGWGSIIERAGVREELSGGSARTTNNQMELKALIEALRQVEPGTRVEIVTDSEYVTKGITSWMRGWIRNGWKTASKQPVKNQELWEELNDLLKGRPHKISWVRGHAGHAENERCDELARTAIKQLKS